MKEFVEKLIGRLEECKKIEECNLYSGIEEGFGYSHCSDAFEDGQTLGAFNAYSSMLDFIKELAEEYNNGWIPCSERLPKCENGCETKALMFQMKETGSIKCGYYGEGGFYRDKYFRTYTNNTDGYDARDVVAWQPLPEPYQKGSDV